MVNTLNLKILEGSIKIKKKVIRYKFKVNLGFQIKDFISPFSFFFHFDCNKI
jgi:hypothetical protein